MGFWKKLYDGEIKPEDGVISHPWPQPNNNGDPDIKRTVDIKRILDWEDRITIHRRSKEDIEKAEKLEKMLSSVSIILDDCRKASEIIRRENFTRFRNECYAKFSNNISAITIIDNIKKIECEITDKFNDELHSMLKCYRQKVVELVCQDNVINRFDDEVLVISEKCNLLKTHYAQSLTTIKLTLSELLFQFRYKDAITTEQLLHELTEIKEKSDALSYESMNEDIIHQLIIKIEKNKNE